MTAAKAAILAALIIPGLHAASPEEIAGREKLAGKWHSGDSVSDRTGTVWILENAGDLIRVTSIQDGKTVFALQCNTVGKECEAQSDGERAKVTMYYNGPRLVQYETRGSHVTKRRFTITGEDGNTLEVETMPISPPGKAETIRFKRQPAS